MKANGNCYVPVPGFVPAVCDTGALELIHVPDVILKWMVQQVRRTIIIRPTFDLGDEMESNGRHRI